MKKTAMDSFKTPVIAAIVAMAENRVIGKNNQLPWHFSADLKRFKTLTTGHPIIMGRKTHESIGKPLPNRTNIVITRDPAYQSPGCLTALSIAEALKLAAAEGSDECFIIGGAELYQQALPQIQRLYLTIIHHAYDGDAYFTELNPAEWQETARETHPADDQHPHPYSFVTLERKA